MYSFSILSNPLFHVWFSAFFKSSLYIWKFLVHILLKLSLVLCDDLEGWDREVEGRLRGKGYVYIELIHFIV